MFYIDDKTARAIHKYPHRAKDIVKSFDYKQVKCKNWLYEELKKLNIPQPKRIYVAGSWYGNILVPLLQQIYNTHIKLHDVDEETIRIVNTIFFNEDAFVKGEVVDCKDIEYKYMVVNCSCEHMSPLNIRKDTIAILQSNNYREVEDHINCVDSSDELAEQYNITDVMYSGQLEFEKYTRFMVIGKI